MCLGSKKTFCIFIVSFFCILSNQAKLAKQIKNPLSPKTKKTTIQTTVKRTLTKSIIETFWLWLKENNRSLSPKYPDVYSLGKITSNLAFVDEIFPNNNPEKYQKIIESLIPMTIAHLTVNFFSQKNKSKKDYEKNFLKLIDKIITKIIIAKFYQKSNERYNPIAKLFAITCAPLSISGIPSTEKGTLNINLKFDIFKGAEKISLNSIKTFMQSNKVNLGKHLNKKHRKKAIAKATKTIVKPYVRQILNILSRSS